MSNKIAIRDAYGAALLKLGTQNENVVALEADVGGSSKSIMFGKEFPERYFNVGIAELNMTAMSAGFALCGKIPFVNTFAVFLASRGADPIASLISYDKLNVKLAGTYCGLSDSYDGASHHAISDIAAIRALPNMTIICPCDAVETEKAVFAAAEFDGPVYLRLSRAEFDVIHDESYDFQIGKGSILEDGNDVTIIANGMMVHEALVACKILAEQSISARIVNMHTIKPFDEELVLESAKKTGAVIVAEEHSIYGGLGSAVAEFLSKEYPTKMDFVGCVDYAESGSYAQLIEKYNLSGKAIAKKAKELVNRK